MTSDPTMSTRLAINSLYMMISTLLLVFVAVGIPMYYSGLTQRRSSFTILGTPIIICAILFLDWFIWSYSLCYSSSRNRFIGNLKFIVLTHLNSSLEQVYSTQRGDILAVVHFLFNGLMKLVCAVLTFAACAAERGRILPMLLFCFLWSVLIYNPVNCWFWNSNGWLSPQLNKLPVLDFAGGTCIHVVSGFTALAYSYYIGPRNPAIVKNYRSSNNNLTILGLIFILFGWSGFISGCDFNFSVTSIYLIVSTFLCAFSAGLMWMILDYYYSTVPLDAENRRKNECLHFRASDASISTRISSVYKTHKDRRSLSLVSFSSGVMCGLVVFTPGGGYLCYTGHFWKSIVCGAVGGIAGNLSTQLKYVFHIDDALDIFAVHGVCGIVGSLLVGIFAEESYQSKGGWIEHNWVQLAYQILGSVLTSAYVFVVSLVLLYLVDIVPGMHLRIDKDYNRRTRAAKKNHSGEENVQISQGDDDVLPDNDHQAELLGTDFHELNGEYSMDFIEFIKKIDPNDYIEDFDHISAIAKIHTGPVDVSKEQELRKREKAEGLNRIG